MTRSNLNFVYQRSGESPKTLYFYYNGDQYPRGLRDIFNVVEWLEDEDKFTPKGFQGWLRNNYKEQEMKGNGRVQFCGDSEKDAVAELISHPAIDYDTAGFTTDYSYVFDSTGGKNRVKVYSFDERIFKGTVDEFIKWIKEQD